MRRVRPGIAAQTRPAPPSAVKEVTLASTNSTKPPSHRLQNWLRRQFGLDVSWAVHDHPSPMGTWVCLTSVNARYTLGRVVEGMSRPRHPDKHIEKAIQYAESLGWRVQKSNSHSWGRLFCPQSTREGCIISIWCTPRDTGNHARQIRRFVDSCPHVQNEPRTRKERDENEAQDRV
jgi:hypothetical protein